MPALFLLFSTGALFTGVAMGAFGAHALKTVLSTEMLEVYKTAVNYQMWHALGLGLVAILKQQQPASALINYAGWLLLLGIILFSGSLYALSLSGLKWLGMITPIGGVCFLSAWLLLMRYAWICYKA